MELWNLIVNFGGPTFWSSVASSFFGAIGGGLAILYIDHEKYKRKKLATINTLLAMIGTNINTLINFKEQHALPHKTELDGIISKMGLSINEKRPLTVIVVDVAFNSIFIPEFAKDYPFADVAQFSYKNSAVVRFLMLSKRAMQEIETIGAHKNALTDKILADPEDISIKIVKYMGFNPQESDNRLYGTTKSLVDCIDAALFFNNKSVEALYNLANITLPCCYQKRVNRITVPLSHKHLMPADDHIKGY
ncbi:MAG: hypothetical protein AB7I18_00745 [Candidatus Berkiella sp.]